MKGLNYIIILLFCLFFVETGYLKAQNNSSSLDTPGKNTTTVYKAFGFTSLYYAGSLYLLGQTWYKNRESVSFHFYNDNAGYLQVDKLGHTFGSYVYSYIGYFGLLKLGATRKDALIFGSTLGLVLQFPIEIMDGLHEGYGFSWGDVAANSMGSALILGQELLFKEQLVKYKFSYWESTYSGKANGYLGTNSFNRIVNDYNGHSYWLSFPINRIHSAKIFPDWLNLAIGYSANGMYGEFENITSYNGVNIPETERYRQYLLSLDIDWTRINTNSKFLRILLKGMTFVKLPFPALEFNSKRQIKGYWIYY